MKTRFYIGLIFIALQVASIFYARCIPERFFCWGPYDNHTQFEVFVEINGQLLSSEQAEDRYQYKMKGWEQRSIYNIFSLITQYEATYGRQDNAKVKVVYATNGHPKQEWNLDK